MFDGICPKCNQAEVRERRARIPASSQQNRPLHIHLFVCVVCGYTETYANAEQLTSIAQSADWATVPAVRPPPGHTPVTGATARLEPAPIVDPPAPHADNPPFLPKKRCPACQSYDLIPGARIVDHGQALHESLTVEVDRRPDALLFREPTPSDLRAWICSWCGYTSIFADHPRELHRAYKASKK